MPNYRRYRVLDGTYFSPLTYWKGIPIIYWYAMLKVTVPWCVKPEDAGLFISIIAISTRLNRLNRAWLGGCLTGLIQASIDRWNGAFIHWIGQVSRPLILLPGNADNGNGLCWVTKLDDSNSNPLLAAGFGIRRNTRRSRYCALRGLFHLLGSFT